MNDVPGYDMTEAQARKVSESLEKCLTIMDETIDFATTNCSPATARSYKQGVGNVIARLYMDVLDAGIYQRYPNLRRKPLSFSEVAEPDAAPLPSLDLTSVPLLHLLAEALHEGHSNFVSGLLPYEPIEVSKLDEELVRRSGAESKKNIADWVDWYLGSDLLSDRERQTILIMAKNKKTYDALEGK